MTTYRLRKGTKAADFKQGSHAAAAVTALEHLKKGTAAQVTEYVQKNKLLKTKMEVSQAMSWILGSLVRRGKLSAR